MSSSQDTSRQREIDVENNLKECAHLERRMSSKTFSEGEREKIWTDFCEKFKCMLINFPQDSVHHNVLGRIWDIFNPRISYQRKLYSKIEGDKKKTTIKKEEAKGTLKSFLQQYVEYYANIMQIYLSLLDSKAFNIETGSQGFSLESLGEAAKPAIVSILYSILVTLGDLYRYQIKLDKAFHYYDMAAFLSPGRGWHFNQITVLEVAEFRNCNALYYCVRSIKASSEPCQMGFKNIKYISSSNRKWLEANYQAGGPVRNDKNFRINLFSAQFVDLHRRLREDTDPSNTNAITLEMDVVIREFEVLLNKNVCSDRYLCRMVAINAFSASNNSAHAKLLVFRFGVALANFMERNLVKELKAFQSESVIMIPGLLPLLLVCEHILTFSLHEIETIQAVEEVFWTKVCILINNVKTTEPSLALDESSLRNKVPEEYKNYEGFTPFEGFISKPSEFKTFENARDIAWMVTNGKPQTKEENSLYEIRVKLAHLLLIPEQADFLIERIDGCYIFLTDLGSMYPENTVICLSDDSDEEEETVSYKTPQHSLLLPGVKPIDKIERKNSKEEDSRISFPNASKNKTYLVDAQHQKFVKQPVPQTEILPKTPSNEPMLNPLLEKDAIIPSVVSPPELATSPEIKLSPGSIPLAQNSIPTPQNEEVWDILAKRPTKNPFMKQRPFKKIKKIVEPDNTNDFLLPCEQAVPLDFPEPKNTITFGEKVKNIKTKNPFFIHRAHIWPNT